MDKIKNQLAGVALLVSLQQLVVALKVWGIVTKLDALEGKWWYRLVSTDCSVRRKS